jgi:hypothetical protein
MLCGSLQGSANALVVKAGERWPLRTQNFPKKNKKKTQEKCKNSVCKMNPRANNTSKDQRHNMHKVKK